MPHTFVMNVKNHQYLYEAESYRNEEGQPRSKKQIVGKVDPLTGQCEYKQWYIDKMRDAGKSLPLPEKTVFEFTSDDLRHSQIKEIGASYLIYKISDKIGLSSILKEVFPRMWREVLTLAAYLACTNDALMYCQDWASSTETLDTVGLSSQRITEILDSIGGRQRDMFYSRWVGLRKEQEYLALDITSISSWSDAIDDVERGYNRDHEKLPQINVCMLLGERTRLPVMQTIYSGSIKDVSTLRTTLSQLAAHCRDSDPTLLVMDKGFYSKGNVDAMVYDNMMRQYRFIIPISFTSKLAIRIIDEEREDIDRAANTIVIGRNSVRGVSRLIYWPISNQQPKQVYAHIIFNAIKASKTKEDLYAHVSMLAKDAELRCKAEYKSDVKKYLSPVSAEVSESRYTINEAALKKELATAGWLVLISNYVETCEEALRIYRAKDVVEKGFMRLKNSLGLSRLRVHTHERTQAKVFVGFLSLILVAYIDRIMFEKDLFKSMTMKEMLFSLKKLRVQYINQHRILFPISKVQKSIFDAFDIVYPV